jgi:hypothetical protein
MRVRSTRDAANGECVLRGRYRRTHEGELVEDAHGRVRLIRSGGASPFEEGAEVVVLGAAMAEEPESTGYRMAARRFVIDTRSGFVSTRSDALERALRAARWRALAGGLLFAAGLGLAAGGAALTVAAHTTAYAEDYPAD